jgi:hypothetical protein
MLYSLLSDPLFVSDLCNLDVNPDDAFGKYQPKDGLLSMVNSGAWYQQVYTNIVKDPSKAFLLPICFAELPRPAKPPADHYSFPLLYSTKTL